MTILGRALRVPCKKQKPNFRQNEIDRGGRDNRPLGCSNRSKFGRGRRKKTRRDGPGGVRGLGRKEKLTDEDRKKIIWVWGRRRRKNLSDQCEGRDDGHSNRGENPRLELVKREPSAGEQEKPTIWEKR